MNTIQISRRPWRAPVGPFGLVLLCTTLWLGGCGPKISDAALAPIDAVTLSKWLSNDPGRYLILDARTEEAFRAGHIPGAKLASLPQIPEDERDPSWESYGTIVVYGEDPGSALARAVAKRLMRLEYSDVVWFEGGMAEWQARGMSVTRE